MTLTIREIAQRAGVSKAAVSYVLNDRPGVSDATRQRILTIMEETGYRPNPMARGLARRRTDMLGLVIPDIGDPFYAHIIRAVEQKASEANFTLVLATTRSAQHKEHRVMDIMTSGQVDGVLLMTYHLTTADFISLKNRRTPFVVMGDITVPPAVSAVHVDNRAVGEQATRHLLEYGHKHIAYIHGSEKSQDTWRRFAGYKAAMAEHRLSVRPDYIQTGDFQRLGGYRAAQTLLSLASPPTAIFAANDQMALGALKAAEDAGVRVPQQLSLIGVDDIDDAAISTPPLTTVRQPVAEMGAKAVDLLTGQIEDEKAASYTFSLKPVLVERGSVAAPGDA